jgi:hypothetical protein
MVIKHLISLVCIILFCISCKAKVEELPEELIARIGDKTISVNEYIQRAEYTIRPAYCKLNYPLHKKIVLNSLIAEKLFALEAGKKNELAENKNFQATMRGIKEQAMRQYLFSQEAYQKVNVDSSEIYKTYHLAGREYDISYYSFPDSEKVEDISEEYLQRDGFFEELYHETGALGDIPKRKVAWKDDETIAIHEALFSEKLQKNQVVGPVRVDNRYVMMKINGWQDTKVLSDTEIQLRMHDVDEKLHRIKATKVWDRYVGKIMRGKTIEFSRDTFRKLERLYAQMYLVKEKEKREYIMKNQLGKNVEERELDLSDLDDIRDHPLYEIDGQVWTVEQFLEELRVRPLVFREKDINREQFPEQFKLAIIDMVRDKYLAQAAYEKGLDEVNYVKRKVGMWQDSYLSKYQREYYLKAIGEERNFGANYVKIIEERLNPYVDSLQKKYSDQIEINIEMFDRIGLTRIDMVAQQPGVPFPAVVPPFPLLTSDHRFDYGKVMTKGASDVAAMDSSEKKM